MRVFISIFSQKRGALQYFLVFFDFSLQLGYFLLHFRDHAIMVGYGAENQKRRNKIWREDSKKH